MLGMCQKIQVQIIDFDYYMCSGQVIQVQKIDLDPWTCGGQVIQVDLDHFTITALDQICSQNF